VQQSALDNGFGGDTASRATGRVLDGALAHARRLHGGQKSRHSTGSKLWWASLGRGHGQQACAGLHYSVGQAGQSFSLNPSIFKYSNTFQIVKYENVTFMAPKVPNMAR
jgi:hypothetical protein